MLKVEVLNISDFSKPELDDARLDIARRIANTENYDEALSELRDMLRAACEYGDKVRKAGDYMRDAQMVQFVNDLSEIIDYVIEQQAYEYWYDLDDVSEY